MGNMANMDFVAFFWHPLLCFCCWSLGKGELEVMTKERRGMNNGNLGVYYFRGIK